MASAIRDINVHEEDLAECLRETIGESNIAWADVSHALGKSERAVRYYGEYGRYNVNAQSNRLKAHEIQFLPDPLRSVIIKFICEHSDDFDTDGTMDNEWCELTELFGQIRHDFMQGGKYSRLKKERFMKICERMFAEWEHKDEREVSHE